MRKFLLNDSWAFRNQSSPHGDARHAMTRPACRPYHCVGLMGGRPSENKRPHAIAGYKAKNDPRTKLLLQVRARGELAQRELRYYRARSAASTGCVAGEVSSYFHLL